MKNMKSPAALLIKSLLELGEWSTISDIAKHSGSTYGRTQGAKLTLLRQHGKWRGKHTLMAKKDNGVTRLKIVRIDKNSSPRLRAHKAVCRKPNVTIAELAKIAGCCTDTATEVRDNAQQMGLLYNLSAIKRKHVHRQLTKSELAVYAAAKRFREIWPVRRVS